LKSEIWNPIPAGDFHHISTTLFTMQLKWHEGNAVASFLFTDYCGNWQILLIWDPPPSPKKKHGDPRRQLPWLSNVSSSE